jgi:hypothetical protein
MSEIIGPARPWWVDAALLTAIGSLFVSMATAVNGCYSVKKESLKQEKELRLEEFKKSKEIELAQNGQFHEIRQKYLDRAIDPQRDLPYRLSVLSFLVDTFGDKDPMGRWAGKEFKDLHARFSTQNGGDYEEFLEWKKKQQISRSKVRGTHSESSHHVKPTGVLKNGVSDGICCVPCQGLTICGKTVTTECGSCSAL